MSGRLILGTVQLGQIYGIANATGKPEQCEADAIVRTALRGGIKYFDTAQGYGNSEFVLKKALQHSGASDTVHIITKLSPSLPMDVAGLRASIIQSLSCLGVKRLYCLMLHRQEQIALLDSWQGEVIEEFLLRGGSEHIGISVYTPEAALRALTHRLISVVQIPTSLFDRRFEAAGVFDEAFKQNKELHIRSIFLQGVMGLASEQLPSGLHGLAPALTELRQICARFDFSPLQLALGWMLQRYPHARLVFGAERSEQVQQNLDFAAQSASLPEVLYRELESVLPPQIPELLNPALWRR